MFTTSTTTTSNSIATDNSSLLVVTQTYGNARTSYSTYDSSRDIRLPLDGIHHFSGTGGIGGKTRKFGKSGNNSALDVDAAATKASSGRRWRIRRQAVVGTSKRTQQDAERQISRARRCVGCLKSFVAFLFSTIGLTILLVGYTILGGLIFQAIESPPPLPSPRFSPLIEFLNKIGQQSTAEDYANFSAATPSPTAVTANSANTTSRPISRPSSRESSSITVRHFYHRSTLSDSTVVVAR